MVKGQLEGETKEAVQAKLTQMGYIILELDQMAGHPGLNKVEIKFGSGVKQKDVAIFARQFATMISAGLSLTKCLSILGAQSESATLRNVIQQLGKDVESGQSLSDSMSKHPKVFPPIFVNMVRAGETGGVLDEVLTRVADHFENELELRGKIKSAMTYPIAMFVLVVIILAAMMIFVVPTFETMFESMGGELPFMTQMLVNISRLRRELEAAASPSSVAAVSSYSPSERGSARRQGKVIWDSVQAEGPGLRAARPQDRARQVHAYVLHAGLGGRADPLGARHRR